MFLACPFDLRPAYFDLLADSPRPVLNPGEFHYGISVTSNLFTVKGMNENDPFLNLNNSGVTNLMLGANDIQTTTVANNGYRREYGSLAGANVNFATRSGTNKFHRKAEYFWNGRTLNANDWFHNNAGTPRPFSNPNQWAASFGGPISAGVNRMSFRTGHAATTQSPHTHPTFV